MSWDAVVIALALAIGENGPQIACFSHSVRTAHSAPPYTRSLLQMHWIMPLTLSLLP